MNEKIIAVRRNRNDTSMWVVLHRPGMSVFEVWHVGLRASSILDFSVPYHTAMDGSSSKTEARRAAIDWMDNRARLSTAA